ncbi:hypothetical protein [Ancylobacter amanitiformis]|uniref:Pimeloyl-ACP methyl ester carboxylesterase n=1 Tax=Ancylobacter amanitiformis TaxID=217069 RepID=A0ABU0LTW7_9HYPH|nr:hypothetical protein [Ancylobacter amanitiformis]MDQ0512114.1 pimeloyl-ACP methyl ester carboxylesterase [Ancylobacter amanitiformis]
MAQQIATEHGPLVRKLILVGTAPRAFSSEVDSGSCEENASEQ